MAANIQLMLKDTVVMEINFDEVLYDVKKPELLPFELRWCIQDIGEVRSNLSKYEVTQMLVKQRKNYDAIIGYLANRVLPITRENAKKVYNLFNFEQVQGEPAKARIAIICRALSLQDNFGLRVDNSSAAWDSVNLRKISLSEAVAQVSLHGTSFTLTNKKEEAMRTPELTGQGSYAKA